MAVKPKIEYYRASQDIKDAVRFDNIHKVLVIKLRHHGDVLLSSPVFQALKDQQPHLEIDALVYQHTRDMIAHHPDITNIFGIDRDWKNQGVATQLKQERQLLKQLENRRYDMLIMLTDQWRGAFLSKVLQPSVSVASKFGNRNPRAWNKSYSHVYPTPNPRNRIESHLDALRRLGMNVDAQRYPLRMYSSQEQQKKVSDLLAKNDLETKRFLLVHPGSRWFYKCWEDKKYATVINHFHQQGVKVAISGAPSPEEQDLIDRITQHCDQQPVMLNGKLSLPELAALIESAACFFGVDSAPMHMAQAVGTPLVALFGPTDMGIWAPNTENAKIISSQHACIPCLQHGCAGSGRSDCIMSIQPAQVIKALKPLLEQLAY